MPDPAPVSDVQPAVSSTAPDAPQITDSSDPLERLNPEQLADWRMTGKDPATPSVTAPTADPPPAAPESRQAAPTGANAKPTASEAAAPRKDAEARIPELLSDRARERERAERAERRLAELEAATAATATPKNNDARPAAPSAAPAGLTKPDPEAFTYGTSDPEYLEALTDYKVAATLATERKQAQARDESNRVISAFESKAAAARAKHPDFDAVAMLAPTEIPPGSIADLVVLEDEAGAEILYHLQQPANAAERRRILKLSPREQFKELVLLGHRLTSGAPAAPSTEAPAVPVVLGSRAAPGDPVERALAADDTAAYIREANRRDMARMKR